MNLTFEIFPTPFFDDEEEWNGNTTHLSFNSPYSFVYQHAIGTTLKKKTKENKRLQLTI